MAVSIAEVSSFGELLIKFTDILGKAGEVISDISKLSSSSFKVSSRMAKYRAPWVRTLRLRKLKSQIKFISDIHPNDSEKSKRENLKFLSKVFERLSYQSRTFLIKIDALL